jgi:hypothetical protein
MNAPSDHDLDNLFRAHLAGVLDIQRGRASKYFRTQVINPAQFSDKPSSDKQRSEAQKFEQQTAQINIFKMHKPEIRTPEIPKSEVYDSETRSGAYRIRNWSAVGLTMAACVALGMIVPQWISNSSAPNSTTGIIPASPISNHILPNVVSNTTVTGFERIPTFTYPTTAPHTPAQ